MTAWSLEAMTEIKPKFTKCLRDGQREARLERSTIVFYAGQVWVQAGKKGAFTVAHMCTADRFLCQGTISRVPLRETTARRVLGVSRLLPAPVAPSVVAKARPKNHFGVVAMQYGGLHSCLVFLVGSFLLPDTSIVSWKQSSWPATLTSQEVRCGRSDAQAARR